MAAWTPTDSGPLERLLEAATGTGLTNETIDPKQEALVRSLLSICTLRAQSISGANLVPELAQAGEGDATIPLIRICARSTGVTQSLALQALKTWCEDHDGCIDKCIHANAVPLLLRILAASLPAAAPGTSAAYSSSMAVILLKALVRQGQDGAAAFLDASGVETLLNLITQPSLDNRSLCLALYLINDTTRRSMEVLNHTINAGAVPHIVDILRKPLSEATKFAALILNRWTLAAHHLPTIHQAGSLEALIEVLVACCVSEATQQDAVDSNTVAYALSALAIMSQNSIDDLRRRLLAAPAALTAVTRAVAHYESCFRGVGFPHAMLCMLCHGPDSDTLAATLALLGLMPAWLAAREVSTHLVERASSQDVLRLLRSVQDPDQALESTISLTHLLPYSPAFLEPLLEGSRLEALAQGALEEMTCGGPGPVPAELISFLPTGEARPLELRQGWRGEAAVSEESCAAHAAHAAHTALRDASVVADLCTATPGGDTAMEEPLQLTAASRSMSFESYFARSVAQRDDTPEDPRRCTSALARLDKLTVAEACCGCKTPPPVACGRKRKRSGEELSPRQPFRKEDVGIPRYDALRFIVGGREVHAVGFVLETHSPFLRGLLSTLSNVHEDVAVPSLGQFSADTMHRLFLWAVEWCYTGAVTDMGTPEDAFELWLLAEFFQVNGLQRYCEIFLERYFEQRPEVLRQCMELTEAYPSAAPLRTLVARHVLSLLTATERCVGAEAVVAMHLGTYATPLAKEMAQVMRSRLLENLAGQ